MNNSVILYFAALVIVIIVAYFYTNGFKLGGVLTTTTISQANLTSTTSSTTTPFVGNCGSYSIETLLPNDMQQGRCVWTGGQLGLWVASGNMTYERVTIMGDDNKTYVNQTSTYQCTAFFKNFSAPSQIYTILLHSGSLLNISSRNSECAYAVGRVNTTLNPPMNSTLVYKQVYNGDFGNGAYTGWTTDGVGFGPAPFSLINATMVNATSQCFIGQQWSNYPGSYFATTYNCGTSNAPGNITSSLFYASQPFLNFKIISPDNNLMYVEILYNGTPFVVAHYNTFNATNSGGEAASTFVNASIPLVTVINKPIQIKVVAQTLAAQTFIAVGEFALGARPVQDKGVLAGPYNFTN